MTMPRMIAGHAMVDLPGGWSPISSIETHHSLPTWTQLAPYSLGYTAVTVEGYDRDTGHAPRESVDSKLPVTMVSWEKNRELVEILNAQIAGIGEQFFIPSRAHLQAASRGPAVNVLEWLDQNKISPDHAEEAVRKHLEYFCEAEHPAAPIFSDLEQPFLRDCLRQGKPVLAYRRFGTFSGFLNEAEVDLGRPVSDGPRPADYGVDNAFGLRGMCGGVSVWCSDEGMPGTKRVVLGTWSQSLEFYLMAGARGEYRYPNDRQPHIGIRLALAKI
jgi:formylglycine-generating enzyme required for sulfatase activity